MRKFSLLCALLLSFGSLQSVGLLELAYKPQPTEESQPTPTFNKKQKLLMLAMPIIYYGVGNAIINKVSKRSPAALVIAHIFFAMMSGSLAEEILSKTQGQPYNSIDAKVLTLSSIGFQALSAKLIKYGTAVTKFAIMKMMTKTG